MNEETSTKQFDIRYLVYVIGILLLGFFYYPIKVLINNDIVFVVVAVIYLVFLRILGSYIARRKKR